MRGFRSGQRGNRSKKQAREAGIAITMRKTPRVALIRMPRIDMPAAPRVHWPVVRRVLTQRLPPSSPRWPELHRKTEVENVKPVRPMSVETFDQTRTRLYQEHQAHGTVSIFWELYPTG
jgi:hypothetical protein